MAPQEDSQPAPQCGCIPHSSVPRTGRFLRHRSPALLHRTSWSRWPLPFLHGAPWGAAEAAGTHLLLVRVDQLLVVPVPQLPGGLGRGQGGVEDEQLPGAVRGLQVTEASLREQKSITTEVLP